MDKTKTGLPFGSGSLQKRGGYLWAIYRDETGKVLQRNLWTVDLELALRRLAELSIPAAVARLRFLEGIAYGEASAKKLGRAIHAHADGRDPRRGPGTAERSGGSRVDSIPARAPRAAVAGGKR